MTDAGAATEEQVAWLVDTYGATLFRVAMAVVGDRHAAEDVVQDVLVKAWTSMPSWEGDVPIRWARVVTRNTALSMLRHRGLRATDPLDDATEPALSVGVEDEVVRRDESDRLWSVLDGLDSESRVMLVMHEVDGLAYDEIAATLEVSVSAVKSRIYRARQTLRRSSR